MSYIEYSRRFRLRNWLSVVAAFGFLKTGSHALSQNDAAAPPPDDPNAKSLVEKKSLELRLGPFNLHPQLSSGLTYDDNILYTPTGRLADKIWMVQPSLQAVAGDDAALIAFRDQNSDVIGLSPGGLIVQRPENWPGKLFFLNYGPRFQFFDKYTANNSIDQFGSVNFLWPISKLILGVRQDYSSEKTTIIQIGQRTKQETITTVLSAAYSISDKTSLESNFERLSVGYNQAGLTGYTEYNTSDWLNYEVTPDLPFSVGVLAGLDEVGSNQNQSYEQVRLRARYNFAAKLVFDISGGGELRQYQNGSPDAFTAVFSAAAEYFPADRTSLNLTGYRQNNSSIFNGYNYSSTGVTLGVSQGITDRFTASLSVSYYILDYSPTAAALTKYSTDYYTGRVGLEAKIIKHLNGSVYYQILNEQTSAGTGSIRDNQVGVQFTLRY